jgi:hypothetical protein
MVKPGCFMRLWYVAPSYTEKGLEIFKGKSKTLRILKAEHTKKGRRSLRQIGGGWLLQDSDDKTPEDIGFRIITSKVPTLELMDDAQFAWLCCKHVKSNATVVAKVWLLVTFPLLFLSQLLNIVKMKKVVFVLTHHWCLHCGVMFFRRTGCWGWEAGN